MAIYNYSCRPKGDNVDVKTMGDDGDSGKLQLCVVSSHGNAFVCALFANAHCTGSQQCFVVFDVLMINDTNLANCPLSERAEQLKK